jgi:hypothetical protein
MMRVTVAGQLRQFAQELLCEVLAFGPASASQGGPPEKLLRQRRRESQITQRKDPLGLLPRSALQQSLFGCASGRVVFARYRMRGA